MARQTTLVIGIAGVATAAALVSGAAYAATGGHGTAHAAHPTHSAVARHDMAGMAMHTTVLKRAGSTITIANYGYTVPASVKPGATITVVNNDSVSHSVTRNVPGFKVTVGAHSRRTFKAPAAVGTYRFHCKFHSDMHGRLVVR